MQIPISKIIFIIGALSAVGMIYLLAIDERNRLFYVLMLISLLSGQLIQFLKWRKGKSDDSN
jgi:hypothetical protein